MQPLVDISEKLIHPKLNKKAAILLDNTDDKSIIVKLSKWLRNPILDYDLSKHRYIAIEGNIGAGKTSLATQIATDFNAKLILERFKENHFFQNFMKIQIVLPFPLRCLF